MKRLLLTSLLLTFSSPVFAEYINGGFYSNKVDPMTDESFIILGIRSNENKKVELGITCKGGYKIQAVLLTNNVLTETNTIDVRWDKENPKKYFWNSSSNRKNFLLGFGGFSGSRQAKKYVKEFREHSSMIVRYPTWVEGTQTVSFDLNKLHPLINRAALEGCLF